MANSHQTSRQRHPPNERPKGDAWVDQVADEVQALLREHGLDFELLVMFDPICEQLHAVGYDGAPRAYFAGRDATTGPSDSPAPRGNPMDATIPNPATTRHETSEEASP
jgi:hypothetical protein